MMHTESVLEVSLPYTEGMDTKYYHLHLQILYLSLGPSGTEDITPYYHQTLQRYYKLFQEAKADPAATPFADDDPVLVWVKQVLERDEQQVDETDAGTSLEDTKPTTSDVLAPDDSVDSPASPLPPDTTHVDASNSIADDINTFVEDSVLPTPVASDAFAISSATPDDNAPVSTYASADGDDPIFADVAQTFTDAVYGDELNSFEEDSLYPTGGQIDTLTSMSQRKPGDSPALSAAPIPTADTEPPSPSFALFSPLLPKERRKDILDLLNRWYQSQILPFHFPIPNCVLKHHGPLGLMLTAYGYWLEGNDAADEGSAQGYGSYFVFISTCYHHLCEETGVYYSELHACMTKGGHVDDSGPQMIATYD